MKSKILCPAWAGLFVLCAGLGFVREPTGVLRIALTAASLAFFVPPALLLHSAGKAGDRFTLRVIRNLAAASLGLTLLLLLANFMSLMASEAVGDLMYVLLIIVSTPMVCCGYWVLSLFLWAFLLFWAIRQLKETQ